MLATKAEFLLKTRPVLLDLQTFRQSPKLKLASDKYLNIKKGVCPWDWAMDSFQYQTHTIFPLILASRKRIISFRKMS